MPPGPVEIGGGFSEGELKFASFWVRNRILVTRIGYGALIGFCGLLWLYILWGLADAFLISYPRESRLTAEIASNQVTLTSLESDQPKNIQTGSVMVLETTDGRFDMAVDLENANLQWWVEFNYRFNISGEQTPIRNGFVMPGSKGVMTELGFRPKSRGGAVAQLVVENIRWHRVDPSQVGERYTDFQIERFNVAFENVTFNRDLVIGSRQVGRTSFDVINRGSYGYWNMDLIVRVYRATNVIGVNRISLTRLVPGETRHVDLDWFENIPSVSRTEIIPVINFLDEESYLPTEHFRQ
ncbi:MAG: hypothetical protein WC787_03495 [Patescibacteria group bacterium]|jgi:hypothetical protein